MVVFFFPKNLRWLVSDTGRLARKLGLWFQFFFRFKSFFYNVLLRNVATSFTFPFGSREDFLIKIR